MATYTYTFSGLPTSVDVSKSSTSAISTKTAVLKNLLPDYITISAISVTYNVTWESPLLITYTAYDYFRIYKSTTVSDSNILFGSTTQTRSNSRTGTNTYSYTHTTTYSNVTKDSLFGTASPTNSLIFYGTNAYTTGANECTLNSLSVTITYDYIYYTLTLVDPENGSIMVVRESGLYADFAGEHSVYGGVITGSVEAVPDDGYEFVSWSDGVTTAERTFTIYEDTTITAYFAAVEVTQPLELLSLTVSSNECEVGDMVTIIAEVGESSQDST